jgi:hypothetical protein
MKPEAIMPLYIDSTMLTCSRSCLEKFRLEFIFGLRPSGISIDLHAGACFATGIETIRKHVYQMGEPLEKAALKGFAAYDIAWGNFEIPEYKRTSKTKERVWDAIYGQPDSYFSKYPPLTDHVQPYFVNGKPTFEFSFAIPLEPCTEHDQMRADGTISRYRSYSPDDHPGEFPLHPSGQPWLYSGRFDGLGSYLGKPVPMDEKTTGGSISTGWDDKWTLRNQFMGYTWACQELEMAVDSVCVRGIAILKTKIDHAEAIKSYSNDLLARWLEQVRRDLWRIRQAWDTGYFDFNFAESCTSYGNCIFLNCCAASDEMRENWFNDFEVRRWNPLTKNPIAEKAA